MIAPISPRLMRPWLGVAFAMAASIAPSTARAQATDTLRLEIGEAVTRALRSSDEARIADAQVALADAQVLSARATGLPQLRLNSGYTQVVKNARADIVGSLFRQNYTY